MKKAFHNSYMLKHIISSHEFSYKKSSFDGTKINVSELKRYFDMIIQLKNSQTLDNIKSGLYFIIDGILYIQTVEDISTATHIEFFQAIIEKI